MAHGPPLHTSSGMPVALEGSPAFDWLAVGVVALLLTLAIGLLARSVATAKQFNRALAHYRERDYERAIPLLEQTIARQRSNDMARLLLGDALIQQNRLEEAVELLCQSVARSPKNVDAHLSLGKAKLQQGDPDSAIAEFQQAARIKPERYPEPHRVLGLALQQQGEAERAREALGQARAIYAANSVEAMVAAVDRELQQLEAPFPPATEGAEPSERAP